MNSVLLLWAVQTKLQCSCREKLRRTDVLNPVYLHSHVLNSSVQTLTSYLTKSTIDYITEIEGRSHENYHRFYSGCAKLLVLMCSNLLCTRFISRVPQSFLKPISSKNVRTKFKLLESNKRRGEFSQIKMFNLNFKKRHYLNFKIYYMWYKGMPLIILTLKFKKYCLFFMTSG